MNKLFFLIIAAGIILCGCADKYENKVTLKLEEVARFGAEQGTNDEVIAFAADFVVDKNENVYVADFIARKIKKYSPAGKLIKMFGKGEGEGPGEFKQIRSVEVDDSNNVYVADMSRNVVAVFDSAGTLIKEIKPKLRPAYLLASSMNEVYFLGFWNHKTDKVISKLDFTKDDPEQGAVTFCERFKGEKNWEIANVGYTGSIFRDKENNIYYSAFYPYYIRKYSKEGKLLTEYEREAPFYKPPYIKHKTPLYVAPVSGSQTTALLSNKYILNEIYSTDKDSGKFILYLDIWDKDKEEFLAMIPEKDLNMELSRYIYADEKGYFYNYCEKPYPHIKKYKAIISYIKK